MIPNSAAYEEFARHTAALQAAVQEHADRLHIQRLSAPEPYELITRRLNIPPPPITATPWQPYPQLLHTALKGTRQCPRRTHPRTVS